ncbi:MAG: hypothetical protein ACE37F_13500 [Nannocystaceae bacterium]|nr:hypothetical protein [bacterium]
MLGLCCALGCAADGGDAPMGGASSSGGGSTATTASPGTVTADASATSNADPAGESTTGAPDDAIVPGVGIGAVALGSRWSDVEPFLGAPDSSLRFGNLLFTTFDTSGLEVLLASPAGPDIDPVSQVLSVAALEGSNYAGVVTPGNTRADIELALGEPSEEVADVAFYVEGVSARYEGDVAQIVTVFDPYTLRTTPPPMVGFEASR